MIGLTETILALIRDDGVLSDDDLEQVTDLIEDRHDDGALPEALAEVATLAALLRERGRPTAADRLARVAAGFASALEETRE